MRSEALKKAQQKYYQKNKDNEEYKARVKKATTDYYERNKGNPEYRIKRCECSRKYYHSNREKILEKKRIMYKNKKEDNTNETINSDTDL